MSYLEILQGKSVAIVGLGYIGTRLFNFLTHLQRKSDFQIIGVNRQNIRVLEEQEFDFVFNCAGNTGDFRCKPLETVESNIQLTTYLLRHCRISDTLVCLGSTRIYGFTADPETIFREGNLTPSNHMSADALYDNAKKMMECLLLNTPRSYKRVVVRLSNVFGDYSSKELSDGTFLELMLQHKIRNEKLTVRQNINSTKDYVFIEDALDGILRAGTLSETSDVYNICSGKSYSVADWAHFLNLSIESTSNAPVSYSRVSNEKAGKELAFVSKFDLERLRLEDVIRYE